MAVGDAVVALTVQTFVVPGDDHAAEIAEIEAETRELDRFADEEKRRALRAERDRLMALPSKPTQITIRPTGIFVAEMWRSWNDQEKRRRLLASGLKPIVEPGSLKTDDAPVPEVRGDPATIGGIIGPAA